MRIYACAKIPFLLSCLHMHERSHARPSTPQNTPSRAHTRRHGMPRARCLPRARCMVVSRLHRCAARHDVGGAGGYLCSTAEGMESAGPARPAHETTGHVAVHAEGGGGRCRGSGDGRGGTVHLVFVPIVALQLSDHLPGTTCARTHSHAYARTRKHARAHAR